MLQDAVELSGWYEKARHVLRVCTIISITVNYKVLRTWHSWNIPSTCRCWWPDLVLLTDLMSVSRLNSIPCVASPHMIEYFPEVFTCGMPYAVIYSCVLLDLRACLNYCGNLPFVIDVSGIRLAKLESQFPPTCTCRKCCWAEVVVLSRQCREHFGQPCQED